MLRRFPIQVEGNTVISEDNMSSKSKRL